MSNKGVPTAASRRLIRERGPEIVRRYEAGESYVEIARSLGVSRGAIAKAVRRFGGTPRIRGESRTPQVERRQLIVRERYEAGESLAAIAADIGISFTTARTYLIRAGGQTRTMGGFAAKPLRGPDHPHWTGGRHENGEGYFLTWVADDHPMAGMRPKGTMYVFEHRLVMAEHIGRPLRRGETVHHINGDRTDNRIENLELHARDHGVGVAMRCSDCGSTNITPVGLAPRK